MTNHPNISVCMITDGADLNKLQRAVQSVFSSCNEVVIMCNGGSYDDVTHMFRNYSKVKTYPQEWAKDFSKARNEALEKAEGEWILIIDSDEELETPVKYLDPSYDCYLCELYTPHTELREGIIGTHYEVRIFRNGKGFQYKGKVHEQVTGQDVKGVHCNVRILQPALLDSAKMLKKVERNAELLLNDLDNPHKDFLLTQLFADLHKNDETILHGEKVIHGNYLNAYKALAAFWVARAIYRKYGLVHSVKEMLTVSIVLEPNQILARKYLAEILQEDKADKEIILKQLKEVKRVNDNKCSRLPIDFYYADTFINELINNANGDNYSKETSRSN